MGGFDEEVYHSLYRVAESMSNLGEPWPDVQDAFSAPGSSAPAERSHFTPSRGGTG